MPAADLLTPELLPYLAAGIVVLVLLVAQGRAAAKPALVGKVSSVVAYPLKSGAGVPLPAATLLRTGLRHDRRWMVLKRDADSGLNFMVTQRTYPKMALVAPEFVGDADADGTGLALTAPGMPRLAVPVTEDGAVLSVDVWDSETRGVDQGDAAAAWFAEFLAEPTVRLVRFDGSFDRPCDATYTSDAGALFADGFPLLLASAASLGAVNARLDGDVTMRRFRPNIVVDGCEAFAEDAWGDVAVGPTARLKCVKPCTRCTMPSVDQTKGAVEKAIGGGGVAGALAAFRSGKALRFAPPGGPASKWAAEVFFGVNAVAEQVGAEGARIAVGDIVVAARRRR